MTHRLYYTEPYKQEFDASVVSVDSRDGRTTIRLDRTAFYPTSGGQPFDTGCLGPLRVVDVLDEEDGTVAHVVEPRGEAQTVAGQGDPEPPPPRLRRSAEASEGGRVALQPGEPVHGVIDWSRRFDHMQQHTGQHVLSAAFDRLFSARTASFHLGAETCTIDLSREMTPPEIAAAEQEANRVVWEDRPVTIRFVTPDEAATLPLRKEPVREGTLRLIEIEGFDLSACGGTHVSRTGAIGLIAVTSRERFKGGQRLEFVCGGRALRRLQALSDQMTASVRLLSVLPGELPGSIERLQTEAKDHKRAVAALQTELARYRAEDLAAAAEVAPVGRIVLQVVDADAGGLKALASAVTSQPGRIVVLVSQAAPALMVVAASPDTGVAAHQLLAALTARFGGRGGGKPDLAQAGGLNAAPQALLDEARRLILEGAQK
jgi:alanyl-tRNA synthetase